MLGGRLSSNDTEDRPTKSPKPQDVGQLGQLPIEKGSDGTNGILTIVSLNVQTNPTSPKAGYKQDIEGRSAESTSLGELHMQTNGPFESQKSFLLNMEIGVGNLHDMSFCRGDLDIGCVRDLDAAQPLQPPRILGRNSSNVVRSENRGGQSEYELEFPLLGEKQPASARLNSIKAPYGQWENGPKGNNSNLQNMVIDNNPTEVLPSTAEENRQDFGSEKPRTSNA